VFSILHTYLSKDTIEINDEACKQLEKNMFSSQLFKPAVFIFSELVSRSKKSPICGNDETCSCYRTDAFEVIVIKVRKRITFQAPAVAYSASPRGIVKWLLAFSRPTN